MSRIISTGLAKTGLLLGYKVARHTGNRQAGGAILAACGLAAFTVWKNDAGTARAAVLTGTYVAAFGASHALAKKIGVAGSIHRHRGHGAGLDDLGRAPQGVLARQARCLRSFAPGIVSTVPWRPKRPSTLIRTASRTFTKKTPPVT